MKQNHILRRSLHKALSSVICHVPFSACAIICLFVFGACATDADTDQLQLSSGYISVTQTDVVLAGQGGSQTVTLTANSAWSATSSEPWLSVTPAAGNGSATLTLTVQTNTSVTTVRTATVSVSTGDGLRRTIHVRQEKNDETLRFNTSALVFVPNGEAKSLVIESNAQWEIMGATDWLTLSQTTGEGNSQITITAQANPLETERTATLTVRGTTVSDRVTITQEGRATTLSVSPTELSFGAVGQTKTIDLVGDASWQASSSAEWLQIDQAEGVGAATLSLSCADNASEQARTAIVTVKTLRLELTVSVTQQAGERPTLTLPVASAVGRETITLSSSWQTLFPVTAYGFAVSRTPDDNGTLHPAGSNSSQQFTLQLTGLTSHATYYIRAYATNKVGTAYSQPIVVTTEGSVPGEDDNVKPNL